MFESVSESLSAAAAGRQSECIRAEQLTLAFQKNPVVSNVTLEIMRSSITAIGGLNGVGKSTLLKALARQLAPASGKVLLCGCDVWSLSALQFAQQVAYVPQMIELRDNLTVEEMVQMGRHPHQKWWQWYGVDRDRQVVDQVLRITELEQKRTRYITQLSGGELQRVLIATGLAQEPAFLLLDEPTAHLDFRHQLELSELLRTLKRDGLGIAMIVHDLNLMQRVADQVVFLKADAHGCGVVAAAGCTDDVLTRDVLARIYGVETICVSVPDIGKIFAPVKPLDEK